MAAGWLEMLASTLVASIRSRYRVLTPPTWTRKWRWNYTCRVQNIYDQYLQNKCKLQLCVMLPDVSAPTQIWKWEKGLLVGWTVLRASICKRTHWDWQQKGWSYQPALHLASFASNYPVLIFLLRLPNDWKIPPAGYAVIATDILEGEARRRKRRTT